VASRCPEHRHPDHAAEGLEDPPRGGGDGLNAQEPTGRSLFGRAAELAAAGQTFAFATVVAVARPTSARPGAHGIVHPDGSIEGWVGGSCAQPVVVREALHAMADGQPRLLRLSKDAPAEGRRGDGIIELVMTCHSGGTLEIYVEPNLPAPVLWVAGTTPIAGALVSLGAASGFAVTLFDPIAEADSFPAAGRVLPDTDLASIDLDATPFVVVATQGQWDEEALAGALRREARYVGLVASPTRAAAVRAWLRDEAGLADDRLAALRAPAGIDLGAETPEEVALSILAELVQVRRGRADFVASPGPATTAAGAPPQHQPALAAAPDDIVLLDPVCGMTVDRDHARHLAEHDGVVYAFCSLGCRTRFVKEPTAYVSASVSSGG
jgi:xanthine dehydrogenase accessory factor